jgi:hypothetical protein
VEKLTDMIQDADPLVAINGGYFWEVNNQHFFDDVCLTKSRGAVQFFFHSVNQFFTPF